MAQGGALTCRNDHVDDDEPVRAVAGQTRIASGASTQDGYGHRVYRSAFTPWIVLALGVTVSFGLYANSLRVRDHELAGANRSTVADTRSTTRRLIMSSGAQARDAASRVFANGALDVDALRNFVDARENIIHASGASGIAVVVPDGGDQFHFSYFEPTGLSLNGSGSRSTLGIDPSLLDAALNSRHISLTNIFQGSGAQTGGSRPEILAAFVGSASAKGTPQGWTGTLMNPQVLASEVLTRVDRLHGLSISEPGRKTSRIVTDAAAPGGSVSRDTVPRTAEISVFGRSLQLKLRISLAGEEPALSAARELLLALGIFVSFLLFAIAHLSRHNERRAAMRVTEATRSLAESEQRFRVLVNEQSDVILVIDRGIQIRWANPTATRILGYPIDELVGRNGLDLIHPDDHTKTIEILAQFLANDGEGDNLEIRARHADGHYILMEVVGTDLSDEPAVGGIVVNLRDLTERHAVEAQLAEARARFQVAFEHAPIGISISGADGIIVRVNSAFGKMLGRTPDELAGIPFTAITHPDDVYSNSEQLQKLATGQISGYQIESRYFHVDGHVVWASLSASAVPDGEGGIRYLISQIEDITERKAIADRVAHQAIHDPMTGLPNRTVFLERLRVALDVARLKGTRVGVIFCDLDHFKWINDTYGHATGDQVLAAVGDRLRGGLRPSDSVARFGGDEFTILCSGIVEERTLLAVAERVHAVIAEPFSLPDGGAYISPSLGIAVSSDDLDTPEALLRAADTAMYQAKASGRACTVVFDPLEHQDTAWNLHTGNALHHALDRGEFRVFYQPLTDLLTGQVVGVESLVRWQHPERGLVEPNDFIPLAEETGLIVPIGRWVLEESCRQAAEWRRMREPGDPVFTLSVNLSPRQLSDPSLASDVADIIARTGIDPDILWLEITETTLMHDAESAVSALRALRAQGVHLAVDDFGTGYSSLLYLKRFPVEALKVDRTFVDGLGREPEDSAIVGAVISLAHSLNLLCVAEGVESTSQLRELQKLGCDIGQGFLFGRPRSARDLYPFPTSAVPVLSISKPH